MERLDQHTILQHLASTTAERLNAIHVIEELDSTNSWLAQQGTCAEVCIAEKQTHGRGRRGNKWSSPASGNIYLSLSWCFSSPHKFLPLTSLLTGISVCEALHLSGLDHHGLKWPNDIFVQDKKLGGILVESIGGIDKVVIGIGLNIHEQDKSAIQQPWCSLCHVMDKVPDRNLLVAHIIDALMTNLVSFESFSLSDFKKHWRKWDIIHGRSVRVIQADTELTGTAAGIDDLGQIRVRLANGEVEHFHSAEISLRW